MISKWYSVYKIYVYTVLYNLLFRNYIKIYISRIVDISFFDNIYSKTNLALNIVANARKQPSATCGAPV